MATITFEQFADKLNDFSATLAKEQTRIAVEAGQLQLAGMKTRIFTDGLNANDEKIGDYSTTPTYVTPKSFPNESDFNKIQSPQWRTLKSRGKNIRLVKLEGGYKELRKTAGLRTDSVDLSFIGDLKESIQATERKNGIVIFIKGEKNIIKARANEKRFNNDIFTVSKNERKRLDDYITDELNEVVKKFFK